MRTLRLPSITVLIAGIGLLLLVPLIIIGARELSRTGERVDLTAQIEPHADRVSQQLRLTRALRMELLSSSWDVRDQSLAVMMSPSVADVPEADFARNKETDRSYVDEILLESANTDFAVLVDENRTVAASSDSVLEVFDSYEATLDVIG